MSDMAEKRPILSQMAEATPPSIARRVRGLSDKGTAKEALDSLVKDWEKVFHDEGKI